MRVASVLWEAYAERHLSNDAHIYFVEPHKKDHFQICMLVLGYMVGGLIFYTGLHSIRDVIYITPTGFYHWYPIQAWSPWNARQTTV